MTWPQAFVTIGLAIAENLVVVVLFLVIGLLGYTFLKILGD
jgi:hypothetical protein